MSNVFRTILHPSVSEFNISHKHAMMMLGSCFTDHIGSMLQEYKFEVLSNPFGVLYNPASLARSLQMILKPEKIEKANLIHHNSQWHALDFHGSFSAPQPEKVIEQCNTAIALTHNFLKNADVLFLTFGTAWVYEWTANSQIVANCHQIPAMHFKRYQLNISQITSQWEAIIESLHAFNPKLKIVFTLSPVRHLKDGFHANQLSKAVLLLAIETLIQNNPDKQLSYFPAYEIIHDDLRDYRFYAPDMVHVSETAVQYIFDHFASVYFNETTKEQIKALHNILLMKKHRILSDNSVRIQQFALKALSEIEKLEKQYPNIKFELEKAHFTNLLQ